jgi:hypothetical protein
VAGSCLPLWPASAKLQVGVFLLTDLGPLAGAAAVGLYHIGEEQAYSHYIVIKWSSGHFVSCGTLAAHGQLRLHFARNCAVVKALAAASVAHAQATDASLIGEDMERQRLEQPSVGTTAASALLPSPAGSPAAWLAFVARRGRGQVRAQPAQTKRAAAAAAATAVRVLRPPAASQRGRRTSRLTASAAAAIRSRTAAPKPAPPLPAHRRAQSAAASAAAAAAIQAVDAAVQAVDASARRAQPPPSASLPESQTTVAQLAAHGFLYDFNSFSNVPQWVGMCSTAFNAYRVASERKDSARQTQTLIDILMLPQRTLTKLLRGGSSTRAAGGWSTRSRRAAEMSELSCDVAPAASTLLIALYS